MVVCEPTFSSASASDRNLRLLGICRFNYLSRCGRVRCSRLLRGKVGLTSRTVLDQAKPIAEVLVEGELSPFEHEAIYKILRNSFRLEQPSYTDLLDLDAATRINLVFHHPYSIAFFTEVFQESWRDLKDLLKQVRYRRGNAGAACTLTFIGPEIRITFKSGIVGENELASALDQIGHLTGVVGQMLRSQTMEKPIKRVETTYDKNSDRWRWFLGYTETNEEYFFDESAFRWVHP